MSEFLGIENSALKFVIAFVLVMVLIGLTAWLIRQFSSARPSGTAGGRARQPRLAVLDSAVVDARRRLVLIRRDNVEHLLMIGGPTDVVVEANVVRAHPAAPMLAPQPRHAPQRAPIEPVEPEYDPSLVPMDEPYYEEPPAPRPAPQAQRPAMRAPAPQPQAPMPQPPAAAPRMAPPPPPPPPAAPRPAAPAAAPRVQPQYSDMAQRLEAALRAPAPDVPPPPARPAPEARQEPRVAPPLRAEPQAAAAAPAAATAAAAPADKAGDVFSTLEEEMANLLKPSGKDPA
ncbi:MAG TPA: flagellar biosynthetic protein FliO [Xanthobacteraceae bacterium]|jgi:flagellar biogenesis protein FliO|nr:flagellar biosynthetic protein FliO [Xanthobacteraceae bacterium]